MLGWVLLQVPRLAGLWLAADVLNGRESVAWLYPAVLDVACAIAAPLVAIALWRRQGLAVWVVGIVFLVVSLVDAIGAVTIGLKIPEPAIFGGPDSTSVADPALFGVLDAAVLWLLCSRRLRTHYLRC